MNSISRARVIGALSGPFPSDFHHFHVENRLMTYKPGLDRVEAWPVELRNSTGWSSGGRAGLQDGFLLLPLRIQLSCVHAPSPSYSSRPICSKMLQKTYFKDQTCILEEPVKNGQEVELWSRIGITWKPKWGMMFSDIKTKVSEINDGYYGSWPSY
ncbi:unnamed protein product [Microthlaspi erraticum]|uniref:Uncharacterized protein n=1 Tax=Microthlaspi erraticum TaxID=1685480 RepID=A0A6D2KYL7_9BRAS|nr:unnamed protein product [Microthlaspi erraticum]